MDWMRTLPLFCQFGVGGVLCGIGIWAGLRSGYLDLRRREDRRLLSIIVAGYMGLLLFSVAFTYWLPFVSPGEVRP